MLGIYLGTTAISWIAIIAIFFDCMDRIEKEGYKVNPPKSSLSDKLRFLITVLFPGYGVLMLLYILFSENFYDKVKTMIHEKGWLVKIVQTPSGETYQDIDPHMDMDLTKQSEMNHKGVNKPITVKSYSEMTIEEKIAFFGIRKSKFIESTIKQY